MRLGRYPYRPLYEEEEFDDFDYIDDYYTDLTGSDEVDESVSRKPSKTDKQRIVDALTIAESITRKSKDLTDIRTALRDIRTELTRRGFDK